MTGLIGTAEEVDHMIVGRETMGINLNIVATENMTAVKIEEEVGQETSKDLEEGMRIEEGEVKMKRLKREEDLSE